MKKTLSKRETVAQHLIEYQLNIIGKTLLNTLDDDKWHFNWTFTQKQYEEFRMYALSLLQKTFKFNRNRAKSTFEWFYLNFGLRIKN